MVKPRTSLSGIPISSEKVNQDLTVKPSATLTLILKSRVFRSLLV
jgi:hypothetical protein